MVLRTGWGNTKVHQIIECTNDVVIEDLGESSLFPSETVKVESQTLKQTLGAEQQQAVAKHVVCREVETNRCTVMLLFGTRGGLSVFR